MNEILKQRIVGAIVITALAAIFVPMLFDDPVPGVENLSNELSLPQEPEEHMQPLLETIPKTSAQILSKPVPAQVDLQSENIKQAVKETNLKSWVIQIGSFSQEQNANEFRDKLRKNKFTAYVDSVATKQGTLYRLRVGPELDEKRAQKTQQQLEAQYKVKTLLVAE
ncbi:SPOR domain-containing protein [Methyloprofundus sp.]|uniref:SPOR domain-containing protein n=1 Tax=Methyloprofundus sp. TaxID=2020875 RepID=UPI003D13221E